MSFLVLSGLRKAFGPTTVVRDFNLAIAEGEFVSLLGPSGCGKTTVLRLVAGFEAPIAGAITIGGQDVVALPPQRRNIGMVFQAYALFPNLTVADNVGFGLKIQGMGRAEREARVAEMLRLIGLPDLGGRYPFQLSGGQQQRVALARALAPKPRVLLLDEPLSALDAKVRVALRNEIRSIQRDLGITTIFVTHDQEEAMSISDRLVVMNAGIAEQVGAPFEIYNRPATRFVAEFVGTLNRLPATVSDRAGGVIRIAGREVRLSRPLPPGAILVAMRPEVVNLGPAPGHDVVVPGRVMAAEFLGSVIRMKVEIEGSRLSLDTFNHPDTPPPVPGTPVEISLRSADLLVLPD